MKIFFTKTLLTVMAVALLITAGAASRGNAQAPVKSSAADIRLPANFVADQSTDLRARIEGYVETVHVDIGDSVAKGQLLVTLSAPELAAEVVRKEQMLRQAEAHHQVSLSDVETAEARLLQARSAMAEQKALKQLRTTQRDRYAELVSSGVVQQSMLDEAAYALAAVKAAEQRVEADTMAAQADLSAAHSKAQFAKSGIGVAEAELLYAKAQDEMRSIKAPFTGLITARTVDPGTMVTQGNTMGKSLLTVESIHVLRLVMTIPAEQAQMISIGNPVTLANFNDSGKLTAPDGGKASVSRISETLQSATRTMRVEIDVLNPLNKTTGRYALLSGQYGAATIHTQQK